MSWYRCFFPGLDGQEAENLLRESAEGSFLIRPSTTVKKLWFKAFDSKFNL